jgi:hypothetical protein
LRSGSPFGCFVGNDKVALLLNPDSRKPVVWRVAKNYENGGFTLYPSRTNALSLHLRPNKRRLVTKFPSGQGVGEINANAVVSFLREGRAEVLEEKAKL